MNAVDLAVLNLKEIRRRSIIIGSCLPDEWLPWKPDAKAFPFIDMIRHIGASQMYYHEAVHTGQFLQYLRMAGLQRPKIKD